MSNINLIPDHFPCPHCHGRIPGEALFYMNNQSDVLICEHCNKAIFKKDWGKYIGMKNGNN